MTEHAHADLIRKLVDQAPLLSDEARTQLAAIFRPDVTSDAAHASALTPRSVASNDITERLDIRGVAA